MTVSSVSSRWGGAAYPAVSGMRDATLRLDIAAHNIANASTEGFRPLQVSSSALPEGGVQSAVTVSGLDGVDLAAEIVGMMMARAAFTANARVFARSAELERTTLDLLA